MLCGVQLGCQYTLGVGHTLGGVCGVWIIGRYMNVLHHYMNARDHYTNALVATSLSDVIASRNTL